MRPHRCCLPGITYLITKRCLAGLFLLTPYASVNGILLYSLLRYARKYGILIHGFCFMENHFHIVLTDVRGNLPDFMRDFLTNSSKAIGRVFEECDGVWDRRRYDYTKLCDLDAAERKTVYSTVNPTAAELVSDPRDWPGVTSARWSFGDTMVAERPSVYFRKQTHPDQVELELTPIALPFDAPVEPSNERIRAAVEQQVEKIRHGVSKAGRRFAGPAAILKRSRDRRVKNVGGESMRKFATRNRALRKREIKAHRQFEREYAEASRRFREGDRDVEFPPGTYGYARWYGARVRAA